MHSGIFGPRSTDVMPSGHDSIDIDRNSTDIESASVVSLAYVNNKTMANNEIMMVE